MRPLCVLLFAVSVSAAPVELSLKRAVELVGTLGLGKRREPGRGTRDEAAAAGLAPDALRRRLFRFDQPGDGRAGVAAGRCVGRIQRAIAATFAAEGWAKVTREPGPMKFGGSVIAFVEDPDGYKIEFIQRA